MKKIVAILFISLIFTGISFSAENDLEKLKEIRKLEERLKKLKSKLKKSKKKRIYLKKVNISETRKLKIRSKIKFRKKDLTIRNWNPPTSLSTHFGWGTIRKNSPVFNFNLNLGYLRYYMRSDSTEVKVNTQNSDFSFIIEIKPFDFLSFLTSGSSYSLLVERNEWLRNLTFILSNKIYSSTQFITSDMLWYFDLLYDGLLVPNVIIDLNDSPTTGLDHLYPPNRKLTLGISDRLHIYRTPKWALGLVTYFEFHIPKKNELVFTDPSGSNAVFGGDRFTSAFTYAALGGLFFRWKDNAIEIKSKALFQRFEGVYDGVEEEVKFHTVSAQFEISLDKRYFIGASYYGVFAEALTGTASGTTIYSHSILLDFDLRGFGTGFEWLGVGITGAYQLMGMNDSQRNVKPDLHSIILIPKISFYPLSFHQKNHRLKISFLYAFMKYSSTAFKGGFGSSLSPVKQSESGWNYVFMGKLEYSF